MGYLKAIFSEIVTCVYTLVQGAFLGLGFGAAVLFLLIAFFNQVHPDKPPVGEGLRDLTVEVRA